MRMADWEWVTEYYWVTSGEPENEWFQEKIELRKDEIIREENAEICAGVFSNIKWIV